MKKTINEETISSIVIDGVKIPLDPNKSYTIVQAAKKAGIEIPTLCCCEELCIKGNCRVCMVELVQQGRLVAACTTLAEPGMIVETASALVTEHRRTVVELILANHCRNCPMCEKNRRCRLQLIADDLKLICEDFDEVFLEESKIYIPGIMSIKPDRCIRCGRCKAYCSESLGIGAIGCYGRGWETRYEIQLGETMGMECTYCGKCTEVCPVGCLCHDPQVDRAWQAIDEKGTETAVIFLGIDFEQTSKNIVDSCSADIERVCGFLKKLGVGQVVYVYCHGKEGDEDFRRSAECAARKYCETGKRVIGVTGDIALKSLAVKKDGGFSAVLLPEDLSVLIEQALYDIQYIEPSSIKVERC